MNAVEIEEEVSVLANRPFDSKEFPYLFLQAFGNKLTTIKKLRSGTSNKSDLNGVLQRNNIHICVCSQGLVTETLSKLKVSPATKNAKSKFILTTDGSTLEAEDLNSGETISCNYKDFPDHFGFFLPLAGIATIQSIRESAFDIKATGRLNKLYMELIKTNPEWGLGERREEINHFLARLIFCFFAEDTEIFGNNLSFTKTVEQMSEKDSSNTNEIISEIFRAMSIPIESRKAALVPRWADLFPYVNGGLFLDSFNIPKFSRIARSYLLHIGNLDWKKINPDIFGSMIQAVADDGERGALGLHYTSMPNILKVLNPLFLDNLQNALIDAGSNQRKLFNLRKRLSKIRVFDPACGSGNFLVIAYKQIRKIEDEINRRRNELGRKSEIKLTNFRGIEIRSFSCEISRLALIIAEYQSNVLYLGQKEALAEFLPLEAENWIYCGNALRLNWSNICPAVENKKQSDEDLNNNEGETFICGNPPYLGSTWQKKSHKDDLNYIFANKTSQWKSLDYVTGWFQKASEYSAKSKCSFAFVSTKSICQGQQVPIIWPLIFNTGNQIIFAHTSFKWSNLAVRKAGVTVIIVGMSTDQYSSKKLFYIDKDGQNKVKEVSNINAYLVPAKNVIVNKLNSLLSPDLQPAIRGNIPVDAGNLFLNYEDRKKNIELLKDNLIRPCFGAEDFISGKSKFCLWLKDIDKESICSKYPFIAERLALVSENRSNSKKEATRAAAKTPHLFFECRQSGKEEIIAIPAITSENRKYLPIGLFPSGSIITGKMYGLLDAPIWNLALLSSHLHLVWVATICVRLGMSFSYSNTLGWNTFPLPTLTEKNKLDLTKCAENILLVRETYFPTNISELYDPEKMPLDLKAAHEFNDEVIERIYIGRKFKNDTERLEKLFDLYILAIKNKEVKIDSSNKKV